jgi:hypothetical protein
MTKKERGVDDKYMRVVHLLYTRAEKLEEQADALRQEASQIEYVCRDMLHAIPTEDGNN